MLILVITISSKHTLRILTYKSGKNKIFSTFVYKKFTFDSSIVHTSL